MGINITWVRNNTVFTNRHFGITAPINLPSSPLTWPLPPKEKAVCQKDDSERKPKPAPKKETEKKQYICPHCSHEFKNKSGYKYHVGK